MPAHTLLNHLQNGARARLRSIPLPYTKASVGIAEILLNHGFIHSFTRGTVQGPSPEKFLQIKSAGQKRLWVDLKYGQDDRPILQHAKLISKPSRKIILDCAELLRLVTGRRAQFINPLRLGEVAIVRCEVKEKEEENALPLSSSTSTSLFNTSKTSKEELTEDDDKIQENSSGSSRYRIVTKYVDAKEAVGRGWGGEVVGRLG